MHDTYLEEANLRLMRYMIERHHKVSKHGPELPGMKDAPGNPEFDAIYARIQHHPRFAGMLKEVESGVFMFSPATLACKQPPKPPTNEKT